MPNKPKHFVSPFGIARWINVNKPNTTFSPQGDYRIKLAVPVEEGELFIQDIKAVFEAERDNLLNKVPANKRKTLVVSMPFEPEMDDEGNPTGYMLFKFKSAASFKSQKTDEIITITIPVVGPDAKPTQQPVFGQSIVRVSCVPIAYYAPAWNAIGITLRIAAVQVKKFASPPATSMFDPVETDENEGTTDEKAPWDF